MAAIARECRETKAPIYLTKNGSASLVVMDAEAFDRGDVAASGGAGTRGARIPRDHAGP